MIDRGDIRQAIDRCSNIWASLPGAGYGRFEHKADSLIAKFKEAGGTVRSWYLTEQSHRDYLRSGYLHHRLPVMGGNRAVITPLLQSPARQKCRADGERGNYWHADASAWCCCARCKIHEELADAKAENDALCVMMLPLVVVSCRKAVCQSVREATTASGVDNAASRLADTAERDYFTLRRGWSLCKNNWKRRSILMSSADRVAHIDGQLL